MSPSTYLVFGDLHGRVLPAFKLAQEDLDRLDLIATYHDFLTGHGPSVDRPNRTEALRFAVRELAKRIQRTQPA